VHLAAFVGVQRDADGSYGSPLATRAVVRALLAEGPTDSGSSRVRFEVAGEARELDVPPSAHLVVPLPASATHVSVRVKGPAVVAHLTVPLPPGATLAEPVSGVRQVQGVLTLRRALDAGDAPTVIELPLRFALEGRFTVPEARAKVAFEEMPRAVVPARPLGVR
jgi:hypothetical protein